ncbi:MAG: hypothetical protein ACXWV4_02590 [Flavitalea sp.]
MIKIFSIVIVAAMFASCGDGGNEAAGYNDSASNDTIVADSVMTPGMMDTMNIDTSGIISGSGTGSTTAPGTGSTGPGTGTNPVTGAGSSGTPVHKADTSR